MNGKFWRKRLKSSCTNPKSKSGPADANQKWVKLVVIVLVLGGFVGGVESQQPKKVPR